jgi:hypothetical protein
MLACTPVVGCLTEISLHPQTDLYRMKLLTEPQKIQAIIDHPIPNFVDRKVC